VATHDIFIAFSNLPGEGPSRRSGSGREPVYSVTMCAASTRRQAESPIVSRGGSRASSHAPRSGPAFTGFADDAAGRFRFIAVEGWMDCRHGNRDGRACVEPISARVCRSATSASPPAAEGRAADTRYRLSLGSGRWLRLAGRRESR